MTTKKTRSNTRLTDALFLRQTDVTPVWIMRQAGRYLPEYRKLRASAGSFLNLCQNPELALEITMQPLKRFELDAAIVFSDILTIPDAMGMGLYFVEGEGPKFQRTLHDILPVQQMHADQVMAELAYVFDAIRLIDRELPEHIPLIGFAGSPWTLAVYMLEQGASKQFLQAKAFVYQHSVLLHQLLAKLAELTLAYLNAQIDAGARVIQIFDTWGGLLTPSHYQEFSLNYMQWILARIKLQPDRTTTPVILFTKGGGLWLDIMSATDAHGLGIDWTISMQQACDQIQYKKALQGNFDPALLHADYPVIRKAVADLLASYGKNPGHIANLGHGITQNVSPEKVDYLVKTIHELSAAYH